MSRDLTRPGFLTLTLRPGEARSFVPAHVDCLLGAARPAGRMDGGGALDRAMGGQGTFRVKGTFHARRSMGRAGQQASGWDEVEESTSLSRTFTVELDDPARLHQVIDRLRANPLVEQAGLMGLGMDLGSPQAPARGLAPPTYEEALKPFEMVKATRAAEREQGSEAVRVGVIDTGVSLGHPELRARLLAGVDLVDLGMGSVAGGIRLLGDTSGRDFSPGDQVGHGSHVAGVIGALGRRMPRGVAGEALLVPLRVLAAAAVDGSNRPVGVGTLADIDAGIKLAVDLRATVLNMSLGTPVPEEGSPLPHAAVARYAEARGTLLVAASGNDGSSVPFYPAALPGVLAVGSVGTAGMVSRFCSTGPHVRLFAPGEEIVSLGLQGYRRSTGTSHAAPFVSGAAALLISRAQRTGRTVSPAELRSILLGSARPHSPGGPAVLDIDAALAAIDQDTRIVKAGAA